MRVLPVPITEAAGLRVSADPAGYVVFEAPPGGAHLTAEQSCGIALDLLKLHSPTLYAAVERAVRGQRLRLVHGGPEDAA